MRLNITSNDLIRRQMNSLVSGLFPLFCLFDGIQSHIPFSRDDSTCKLLYVALFPDNTTAFMAYGRDCNVNATRRHLFVCYPHCKGVDNLHQPLSCHQVCFAESEVNTVQCCVASGSSHSTWKIGARVLLVPFHSIPDRFRFFCILV